MDKFVDSFSRGHKKQKITQTKPKKNVSVQPTHQQMYLDLGQKLFGKSKECSSCGMLYVIGDADDERRHDQSCAKAKEGPILSSLKGHRLLTDNLECKNGKKSAILEVRAKLDSENIANILRIVGNELGSSPNYVTESKKIVYLYVLEGTKNVIGCLIAEKVAGDDLVILSSSITATDVSLKDTGKSRDDSQGYTSSSMSSSQSSSQSSSKLPAQSSQSSSQSKLQSSQLSHLSQLSSQSTCQSEMENRIQICFTSGEVKSIPTTEDTLEPSVPSDSDKKTNGIELERPSKMTLGIRQIWVHSKYRRSNIARSLVDTARKHFFFGTIVMRSQVAFSQPTSDGLKFALSYSQNETVWAYA